MNILVIILFLLSIDMTEFKTGLDNLIIHNKLFLDSMKRYKYKIACMFCD